MRGITGMMPPEKSVKLPGAVLPIDFLVCFRGRGREIFKFFAAVSGFLHFFRRVGLQLCCQFVVGGCDDARGRYSRRIDYVYRSGLTLPTAPEKGM